MGGTKREAVVQKRRVDHVPSICPLQKVTKITQMSVASSHPVSSAIFIQNKHLPRAKPSLQFQQMGRQFGNVAYSCFALKSAKEKHLPDMQSCHLACGPT